MHQIFFFMYREISQDYFESLFRQKTFTDRVDNRWSATKAVALFEFDFDGIQVNNKHLISFD